MHNADHFTFLPRGADMKFKILHSIDMPIEQMSVAAICEKAGISRQSFYNHFESKYQIAYWVFDLANTLYFGRIGSELTWEEGVHAGLEFLEDERLYLVNAFAENPTDIEVEPFFASRRDALIDAIEEKTNEPIDDEMRFYVDFYIAQGNQLVVDWLLSPAPVDTPTMTRYLIGCVPQKLREALGS